MEGVPDATGLAAAAAGSMMAPDAWASFHCRAGGRGGWGE